MKLGKQYISQIRISAEIIIATKKAEMEILEVKKCLKLKKESRELQKSSFETGPVKTKS